MRCWLCDKFTKALIICRPIVNIIKSINVLRCVIECFNWFRHSMERRQWWLEFQRLQNANNTKEFQWIWVHFRRNFCGWIFLCPSPSRGYPWTEIFSHTSNVFISLLRAIKLSNGKLKEFNSSSMSNNWWTTSKKWSRMRNQKRQAEPDRKIK